jgi:hypothetical protein
MNKNKITNKLNELIERFTGLRFQPSSNSRLNATRKFLLNYYSIKHVLDVGANKGQYAQEIRSLGFKEWIYSFEPTSYYEYLAKASEGDTKWQTYRFGFGIAKTLRGFLDSNVVSNIYLKIDTQGNEMNVLLGLSDQINQVLVIEFESALIPLYKGETDHYEIAQYLISHGFKAKQIVITHWNQNKETISLDSIFVRAEVL